MFGKKDAVRPFPKNKSEIALMPEYCDAIEKYDYLIKWINKKGRTFFIRVEDKGIAKNQSTIKIYYFQEVKDTNAFTSSLTKVDVRRVLELNLELTKKDNKNCINCKYFTACGAKKYTGDNKTTQGLFTSLMDLPMEPKEIMEIIILANKYGKVELCHLDKAKAAIQASILIKEKIEFMSEMITKYNEMSTTLSTRAIKGEFLDVEIKGDEIKIEEIKE